VIDEPIELSTELDRDSRVEEAIHEFAVRLDQAIRAHPESWSGWGAYWGGAPPFISDAG